MTANLRFPVIFGDAPFTGIPVKITNQLSVPLDIYDVFNPATLGQFAPFVYTKLGTIAAGATGTVTTIREVAQVAATYTGAIPELQDWYYHQFPVKLMSGTQSSFGNPPPISYTVTDADRQSMIQSFLFHKFAMANPDSTLTKNLDAALKSTDAKAVNAFFAGTANFKACTLSSWNAVMTWLTMFTSGWQGPYYLYEVAPANPPKGYVPALIGTLKVTSSADEDSAALTLCSQDEDGGLHPLSPPGTASVAMAGDGTMVDLNPGADVSVALIPVWMNAIQTTMNDGQPQTSYISGPVVTGTVAGRKVVSTQTLMPLPSQAPLTKDQLLAAGSQAFNTICQLVGLIAGLGMLYQMARGHNATKQQEQERAKREATSEPDYERRVQAIDEDPANGTAEVFTENADVLTRDSAGVADGYAQVSQVQQREVLTEAMNSEAGKLGEEVSTQLENGLTPSKEFEDAYCKTVESFKAAQRQIEDGNLAEASQTMSDAAGSMQRTLDESAARLQESEISALETSADAVAKASEQADALNEAQEQYEERMADEASDSGASDEDITPETDPIPEGI